MPHYKTLGTDKLIQGAVLPGFPNLPHC